MPFTYERDEVHQRAVITFEGAFLLSEALASVERRRVESAVTQPVLVDIRRLVGQPNLEDLRQLLREDLSIPTAGQSRGPIAIVATVSSLYAKACTFAAMAQSKVRVQVFRDVGDADSWLKAQANDRSRLPETAD
jgi:hypothetical protein